MRSAFRLMMLCVVSFSAFSVKGQMITHKSVSHALLMHFWDEVKLNPKNPQKLEEDFTKFLSRTCSATDDSCRVAVNVLLNKAERKKRTYRIVNRLAEKYLYDESSPYYNESLYLVFLQRLICSSKLSEAEKIRPRYQLEMMQKNEVHQKAADFAFITREGREGMLSALNVNCHLLLFFFNPDCVRCQNLEKSLKEDELVNRLIFHDSLSVLAVDLENDTVLWKALKDELPQNWNVALSHTDIGGEDLYDIRRTPAIFLLDSEKRVLLKNTSLDNVLTALRKRK